MNDSDNGAEWLELLKDATDQALDNCRYLFINIQMLANNKADVIDYLYNYKPRFCDVIIWDKILSAPAMAKKVLNAQFEFIFVLSKISNSRAIGTRDFRGTITNIYEGMAQRTNEYSDVHGATFPIHLPSHFITSFTNDGGFVLDLFGGTGTTLIAAEQFNRTCYMMELDPRYCDIILDRWEKFTGENAEVINGER